MRLIKGKDLQPYLLSILLGIALGLGAYTFIYARGLSYVSDDPEACKNCHVMNTVFEDWMKGGHQHAAVCNDCHVPHGFVGKVLVKALNGFNHSYAFTFLDVPIAIRATGLTGDIAQSNCERCHGEMAAHAVGGADGMGESLQCLSCHREAGHRH